MFGDVGAVAGLEPRLGGRFKPFPELLVEDSVDLLDLAQSGDLRGQELPSRLLAEQYERRRAAAQRLDHHGHVRVGRRLLCVPRSASGSDFRLGPCIGRFLAIRLDFCGVRKIEELRRRLRDEPERRFVRALLRLLDPFAPNASDRTPERIVQRKMSRLRRGVALEYVRSVLSLAK